MLKLAIVSDLHLDYHALDAQRIVRDMRDIAEVTDAIIIAGDLVNGIADKMKWVKDIMGTDLLAHCIYVPGNHDYWESSFGAFSNVRDKLGFMKVLDAELWKFGNLTLFGGTLWFPKHIEMERIGKRWADMAYIKDSKRIFEEHERFKHNIKPGVDIVISHHLPTYKSVHPNWATAISNIYFASHCDKMIEKISPKIWIHGHTHNSFDYQYNKNTRVICNPCGYPGEASENYKPLIIEV